MEGVRAASELPDDVKQLKVLFLNQKKEHEELQRKHEKRVAYFESIIRTLTDEVALFKKMLFGRSSEKWSDEDERQMLLFDEAEAVQAESKPEPEDAPETGSSAPRRRGRRRIPANIPREKVVYELNGHERECTHCGRDRPEIGSEESEELQFIPARLVVKTHVRRKYGPCGCEGFKGDPEAKTVTVAPMPPRILPGSIASSGLLSHLLVSKFCDAIPFYRMERLLERSGIRISRTNMANWTIKSAGKCADLIDLMREKSRDGPLINMDETAIQVLKEPGRKPEQKSRMWVTVAPCPEGKIVLYNYSRSRGGEVAISLLEGFRGTLQTDGYAGYSAAVAKYSLHHAGCLAHVRRKFLDAAKISKSGGLANKALKIIRKIYRIENELRRELDAGRTSTEEFLNLRRRRTVCHWRALRDWLRATAPDVPPQCLLGRAINYAIGEFPKLVRILRYWYITPDNNAAERAIRPFVVGRKNWLFADTPGGAHASAVIYSLIETAKANGLNPQLYLYQVFERLPSITPGDREALAELLPWNIGKRTER